MIQIANTSVCLRNTCGKVRTLGSQELFKEAFVERYESEQLLVLSSVSDLSFVKIRSASPLLH